MLRTSVLRYAILLAGSAACASAGSPAPVAVPGPAPAVDEGAAPERIEEGFAIEGEETEPVRDGLLGAGSYDLPVVANQWVQMEMDFLLNQRRATVGRWLERGERYREWVQDVFAGYGIPRDLHHLAMVESGYTPTARSHAGALGMWQFMPATGRGMGLRIDDLVDERMDPVRSTHAAARHLRDLHRSFGGDWALAAAAYNAGAGRINRGMSRFGARDFWELAVRGDLAQETRHYVPRLYAVTIIARDPARFGYVVPRGAERFAYDSVRVDVPTPLSELARVGDLPVAQLADLNPHLRRGMVPADYWVWTPATTGAALQAAFDTSALRREGGYGYHTLRRGETVADVAAATGLSMDRLRDLNLSIRLERLGRGDRVRLPAPAVTLLSARPAGEVVARATPPPARTSQPAERQVERSAERPVERQVARSAATARPAARPAGRPARAETGPSDRAGRSHTVERGETLWGIARRFDVTVSQLRDANGLGEALSIQPGQALRIPAEKGEATAAERAASATPTPDSRSARHHTVLGGDTLWSIARRYDSTVEAIRAANRLAADAPIRPGQQLRIPGADSVAR